MLGTSWRWLRLHRMSPILQVGRSIARVMIWLRTTTSIPANTVFPIYLRVAKMERQKPQTHINFNNFQHRIQQLQTIYNPNALCFVTRNGYLLIFHSLVSHTYSFIYFCPLSHEKCNLFKRKS